MKKTFLYIVFLLGFVLFPIQELEAQGYLSPIFRAAAKPRHIIKPRIIRPRPIVKPKPVIPRATDIRPIRSYRYRAPAKSKPIKVVVSSKKKTLSSKPSPSQIQLPKKKPVVTITDLQVAKAPKPKIFKKEVLDYRGKDISFKNFKEKKIEAAKTFAQTQRQNRVNQQRSKIEETKQLRKKIEQRQKLTKSKIANKKTENEKFFTEKKRRQNLSVQAKSQQEKWLARKNQQDKALSNAKFIKTPQGKAVQSNSKEAIRVREYVKSGGKLYRIGTTGISDTAEAQYWAIENPLLNLEKYSKKYGLPFKNIKNSNFVETAVIKPGTRFITRPSQPALGNPKDFGGGIEVVVEANGVRLQSYTTIGK